MRPTPADDHPCSRCGRLTEAETLRLHTTRERLREYTRRTPPALTAPALVTLPVEARITEPPGPPIEAIAGRQAEPPAPPPAVAPRRRSITYRWVTYAHLLCPDCHAVVEADGRRLHDHDRRRFVVMLIAAVLVAGLIWLSFTTFMPNWIAAFWRNGADAR